VNGQVYALASSWAVAKVLKSSNKIKQEVIGRINCLLFFEDGKLGSETQTPSKVIS
jgi:hypothetical protein